MKSDTIFNCKHTHKPSNTHTHNSELVINFSTDKRPDSEKNG